MSGLESEDDWQLGVDGWRTTRPNSVRCWRYAGMVQGSAMYTGEGKCT